MLYRLLALCAVAITATEALGMSGYAHGPDHCYYFETPSGWTMDNRAGARDGVPMVFYPSGTTWQSAPVAIYTRPVASARGRSDSARVNEQVQQVIQMYRSASETIQAVRLRTVRSSSGASGELWKFTGYSNGGMELVTYFPAPQTINFFVMQVPPGTNVDASLIPLLELSASYRTATDCKPCSGSNSCTLPN